MSAEVLPRSGIDGRGESSAATRSFPGIRAAWRLTAPYLMLLKLRIVLLLEVVALTSAVVAAGGAAPASRLSLLLLSGALASAGASALNHYLDRDIDALMRRTRLRPLPAGKIKSPKWAAAFGLALLLASVPASLPLGLIVTTTLLLGALFYVVVYTWWLKRRTHLNVVIGGAAGSFAALAGWAAVDPSFSPLAVWVAAMLFLWTPLHFWNLALVTAEDYRRAGVPMLPVVMGARRTRQYIAASAVVLVFFSLLPWALGYLGGIYVICAAALSCLILGNLRRKGYPAQAWTNYKLSGLYLMGMLVAMILDVSV